MKRQQLFLFFVLLGLISWGNHLLAQGDFTPLQEGRQYHYRYDQNGYWVMQFDSSSVNQQGDSVFWINPTCRPVISPNGEITRWTTGHNNIFLRKMIKKPLGEYDFVSVNGDTVQIFTQAPPNSTHPFIPSQNTNAFYQYDFTATTFGQPDTVLQIFTIGLQGINISKKFGILESTDFRVFFDSVFYPNPLTLHQPAGPGFSEQDFFNFQVGDQLGYKKTSKDAFGSVTQIAEERLEAISRQVNGNIVEIAWERTSISRPYPSGAASFFGPDTIPSSYTNLPTRKWSLPSFAFDDSLNLLNTGYSINTFTGQVTMSQETWERSFTPRELIHRADWAEEMSYRTDLGLFFHSVNSFSYWEKEQVCYNTSLWPGSGPNCGPLQNPNGLEEDLAAQIHVYPVPAQSKIWIESPFASSGKLISAQGQTLQTFDLKPGKEQLDFPNLPNGIYWLIFPELNTKKTLLIQK